MAEAIIFVPCFDRASPRFIVNYGALAVATALKEHGVRVVYIDGAEGEVKDIYRHIAEELPDCRFFGVSAFTVQVNETLAVSEFVKSIRPNLPILWGGIHASLLPEETARDVVVDYVCVGEGDDAVVEFYDQLVSGRPDMQRVHNLVYWEGDELVRTPIAPFFDMQRQTSLAWDLLAIEKYVTHDRYEGNGPGLGIPVGRGCPHRCSFCINVALKEYGYTTYRYQTPESVANDLSYLKERLGIGFSFIRDEVFFVNPEYSRKIANIYHNLGIRWVAANYFTAKRLTADFMQEMHDLGMLNGSMGVESGSPRLLQEVVCKDITLEQVEQGMQILQAADIRPTISFIIGFPTETPAETQQTIDLAVRLKRKYPRTIVAGVYLLRPYPGAPVYDLCIQHGLKVPHSLREWGDASLMRQGGFAVAQMPWLNGRKNLYQIGEYTTASLCDIERSAGIVLNVYILMAKIRRTFRFYALPWELWIFGYVKKAIFLVKRLVRH